MLALAHHLQWAIDQDDVPDAATVARRLGLTRARVSQLLGLCLLAPDIQEEILGLEAVDGVEPMAERALRGAATLKSWGEQRVAWTAVTRARILAPPPGVRHCRAPPDAAFSCPIAGLTDLSKTFRR
ncbi:hypothetical protein ACFL5O_03585 [Myxococcota bacterium]